MRKISSILAIAMYVISQSPARAENAKLEEPAPKLWLQDHKNARKKERLKKVRTILRVTSAGLKGASEGYNNSARANAQAREIYGPHVYDVDRIGNTVTVQRMY